MFIKLLVLDGKNRHPFVDGEVADCLKMNMFFSILFSMVLGSQSIAMSFNPQPPCTDGQVRNWKIVEHAYSINESLRLTTTVLASFSHMQAYNRPNRTANPDGDSWWYLYFPMYFRSIFAFRDCHIANEASLEQTESNLKSYTKTTALWYLGIQFLALTNTVESDNRNFIVSTLVVEAINEIYFHFFWHPNSGAAVSLLPWTDPRNPGLILSYKF